MGENNKTEVPSKRRSCYDCEYCRGAISLWCLNPIAVKIRGTRIPGVFHCPYWKRKLRYDDGYGFDIPDSPNRVFRILKIVVKRMITKILDIYYG